MYQEILKKQNPTIGVQNEKELFEFLEELKTVDQLKACTLLRVTKADPSRTDILLAEPSQIAPRDLVLETTSGNYLLRAEALQSVENRADISCRLIAMLLDRGKQDEAVGLINLALTEKNKLMQEIADAKDKSPEPNQIYLRAGRCIAAHSAMYSHISQKEIYEKAFDVVRKSFPDAEFESMSYTHDFTDVTIALGNHKSKILTEYRHAWLAAGYGEDELSHIKPVVRVCTSDTGMSSVGVLPMLVNSHNYLLGERLNSRHYGNNSLSDIEKNLEKAFAKAQESLARLSELMSIELENPIPAMVRVMEHGKKSLYSLSANACEDVLSGFKFMYGGINATAFDLYMALCEMEYCDRFKNLKENSAIMIVEGIYRTIHFDWKAFDAPGKEYLGDGTKKKGGK